MSGLPREILAERSFNSLIGTKPAFGALYPRMAVRGHPGALGLRETDCFTIAVLGKCGHGKSSLLNALVGDEIFKASHVGAGTLVAQSVEFSLPTFARSRLSIMDLPGIGEAEERNKAHLELYRRAVENASALLYVIKADQRDLAVDQWVFSELLRKRGCRKRLTLALTQVDKLHPINRRLPFRLTPEQELNLDAKIRVVRHQLRVKRHRIVGVAAPEDFGIDELVLTIAGQRDP